MYNWAVINDADYNGKKFVKVTFGNPEDTTPFNQPNGNIIESKVHVKDLGVYMSADISFDYIT